MTKKAKRTPTARISKKAVQPRKKYPFEKTKPGESFVEDDISQWPRLRVSAGRYNKKHGTNFRVTTEKKDNVIVLIRCGEPAPE